MKMISIFLMFTLFSSLFCFSSAQAESIPNEDQWIGIGSDWRLLNKQTTLTLNEVMNLWRNDIETKLQSWSFNTVRLAFAFPDTGVTTRNVVDYEELDQVLDLFDSYNIKVILDLHNYQDMEGYFGSEQWINDWTELANNYKNDDRIIAFEIFNEPFGPDKPSRINTWDPNVSGGGSNISDGTEGVASALADCVDAIRATGDNHPIVYPDPWWFRPTKEEVENPQTFLESGYSRDNIVVTMHPWFLWDDQSIDKMYNDFFFKQIEQFEAWSEYYTIWIGEFGAASPNEKPWNTQKTLCIELVNYALSEGIGFNFWIARDTLEQREGTWDLIEDILESSAFPNLLLTNELDQKTQEYDELQEKYNKLQEEYNLLSANYTQLLANISNSDPFDPNNASETNGVSLEEYNLLLEKYDVLEVAHNELETDYEKLTQDYDKLELDYLEEVSTDDPSFYPLIAVSAVCVVLLAFIFVKTLGSQKIKNQK